MSVDVCVACGAATLEWTTLERLIGVQPGQLPGGPQPQPLAGAPVPNAPPPPAMSPPAMLDDLPPPLSASRGATPDPISSQPPPPAPRPLLNEPGLAGVQFRAEGEQEPGLGSSIASTADDDAFERQLIAAARARRNRTLLLAGLAMAAAVIVLVAVPISYTVFHYVQARNTSVVQNAGPSDDVPELGDVVPEPEPEPSGTVTVEPEDEPEPEPEPKPKPPPKPKVTSLKGLIDKGWNQVGKSPTKAAATFQQALAKNAAHPEANYGYGYALLQQGNKTGAKPYLCRAVVGDDIATKRDVTSLLSNNSLTCP